MTFRKALPILFTLSLAVPSLMAEAGRTAGVTLLRTAEGRPTGMGGAFTSIDNDIQAVALNPAAAGTLNVPALSATFFRGIADDNLGIINYGQSAGYLGFRVGGVYYNSGDFEASLLDGTEENRTAQEDMVGIITVGFGGQSPLSLGLTGKFYRFELAEEASASGIASDAGILWKTPVKGLNVGGSVLNMGPDVQYEVDGDPLPTTARTGISYDLDFSRVRHSDFPYAFLISVDGIFPRDEGGHIAAGLEVRRIFGASERPSAASFRGGYSSDTQSVMAGLGFKIKDFLLDYSIGFKEDFDNSHRVTLGYQFSGRAQEAPRVKGGRLRDLED